MLSCLCVPSAPSLCLSLSVFFTPGMFSSSLCTLITELLQLQPWQTRLVMEGCDRHANDVLDVNNMLETRRAGERGRAAD